MEDHSLPAVTINTKHGKITFSINYFNIDIEVAWDK